MKITLKNFWLLLISLIFTLFNMTKLHAQFENKLDSDKISHQMELEIDSILAILTLKEKVAMCHAQSKFSVSGVERLGIPEIWMADGPHGVRAEISWDDWSYAGWTNDSITAFPALTCLAASFSPELSGEYGFNLGEEARYRKKDILLGPGVNIYRTPLNGRNFEYMGEDPFLASELVVPYIKGVQKNGVSACVKHFALNNQELWRDSINVEISDRALHEIYLPAFKAAVQKAKVWSIMGAYNKYKRQYCCHNEILLNNILKTDWGFDGVVISDWGGAHSTKESALYGLDIEMGTGTDGLGHTTAAHYNNYYLANPFFEGLKNSKYDEALVNDKVRRILRLILRTNMSANRPFGKLNTPEHHAVARKVATEGIVLLKNLNNFLPIKDDKNIIIAVIGENATRSMTAGGGSSELKPQFEISPLEGLKNKYKNATITHAIGYETGPSVYDKIIPSKLDADSLRIEAIKIAKEADIVLFFGGLNKSHLQDCEGADRKNFGLPFGQEKLLSDIYEVNNNIGFILVSGNAVEMPWLNKVNALVETWYLGSISGLAIADIICGDVNPSGKLPFSFPKKLSDNAAHYFGESSYPGINHNQIYKEDILVGYRWHETKNIEPLYAFGYGMSYTNFYFEEIKTNKTNYSREDTIIVTCTVENTGVFNGSEVVQVYIGKPISKVKRAVKELKGFKKIQVEKGTKETISISIPTESLAFYDESISNWNLEDGVYIIYVGNASNNILKEIEVTIN